MTLDDKTDEISFPEPPEAPAEHRRLEIEPPSEIAPLITEMKETIDKLVSDRATRGDVKLLRTALKELRYCFRVFNAYRHRRKVTVFGSARTPPEHPTYQAAVEFGRQMAAAGYMVITGAASGIMEAGHVGAGREDSIGINILLPFEQRANPIILGDRKLMSLKYFFTRKLLFMKESHAVVLFPGGFGTQDEGFEALTLIQTGKSNIVPVVLVEEPGGDYWRHWLDFVEGVMLPRGMISEPDRALYYYARSVEDAVREVTTFYRVFHSMRYVRKDLVFRLNNRLSESLLRRINTEFADILESGEFEQTEALPSEANEEHLLDLPRLRFRFDKHSHGRLRMLIDLINREG